MEQANLPKNIVSNAFLTTTQKGKQVYRIKIDVPTLLTHLEQGKTIIAFDLITNGKGLPKIVNGKSKTGYSWTAIPYYTWAMKPREEKHDTDNQS